MASYLDREHILGEDPDLLNRWDGVARETQTKNPRLFQVIIQAETVGIRPAFIVNALLGGEDAFDHLSNPRHPFTVAAYVVATTENSRSMGAPDDMLREMFGEKISDLFSRKGIDQTLLMQTARVIQDVYPEYSSVFPTTV